MIRVDAPSAGGSAGSPLAARRVNRSATVVSSHDVGRDTWTVAGGTRSSPTARLFGQGRDGRSVACGAGQASVLPTSTVVRRPQRAGRQLGARSDAELGVDAREVELHGLDREHHLGGDLLVA